MTNQGARDAPGRGGKGWGDPPPPSLVCTIRPRVERRGETIKQIERQAGSSNHESRPGKFIRTV